ncbi:MAG TPA: tryptophan 2,3-dioxygenase family protein [Acidimicrobiia bacterium]|nr:tryptophan 2,3-dioxygenase family protein [Acidimicrobiia bacterium]
MPRPQYYPDYLHLDKLLSAQVLRSAEEGSPVHDEMLFIVVHQAYELWFKQILWELAAVARLLGRNQVDERDMLRIVAHLERVKAVQVLLIEQVDVLETMTPLDFHEFRNYLIPASGFQSVQFRLIENRLGLRREDRVRLAGAPYTAALSDEDRRLVEASESDDPSLFDLVKNWLERTPFLEHGEFRFWDAYRQAVGEFLEHDRQVVAANPNLTEPEREAQLQGFEQTFAQYEAVFDGEKHEALVSAGERRLSHRAFQAALFINLYRDEPALQQPFRLLTSLMDVDEGFTTWRYRHALMTTRMIGRRVGTGGSAGAAFLTRSAEKARVFTDFFQLSTFLIPRSSLPPLPPELERDMHFRFKEP